MQQSMWRISDTENISGLRAEELVPGVNMRYSFHLNLSGNLGFALGTGVSAFFHPGDLGGSVTPGTSLGFPSLALGLVQNFGQSARITGYFEYAAVYFHRFRVWAKPGRDAEGNRLEPERVSASFVPDSLSAVLLVEQLVTQSLALCALGGYRFVSTYCLGGGCGSSAFVNTIQFRQEGFLLGLGLNWSLGSVLGE